MSEARAIVSNMDDSRVLRGIELRYALTNYLAQHGRCSISTLIEALEHQGFVIAGNPPKSVSDALRWEMAHCRVLRRGRGVYDVFEIPRSTEYRIHHRVMDLRARATRIRAELGNGDGGSGAARCIAGDATQRQSHA